MSRQRLGILVLVLAVLGGGGAFLLTRTSDRDRALDACHAAISRAPGGNEARYDEQVATPGRGKFVVTGAVGATPGTAKQWTCEATVKGGVVTISSAEIRQ